MPVYDTHAKEQRVSWIGKCTDKIDVLFKGCNLLELQKRLL